MTGNGWDDWLALASRPTKSVRVCVSGDRLEQLHAARAGDDAEQIAAAERAVAEATRTLTLRGLTFEEYRAVADGIPDDAGDTAFGTALLKASLQDVPAGVIDRLPSELTFGQWDDLINAAMEVTNTTDPVPLPNGG